MSWESLTREVGLCPEGGDPLSFLFRHTPVYHYLPLSRSPTLRLRSFLGLSTLDTGDGPKRVDLRGKGPLRPSDGCLLPRLRVSLVPSDSSGILQPLSTLILDLGTRSESTRKKKNLSVMLYLYEVR